MKSRKGNEEDLRILTRAVESAGEGFVTIDEDHRVVFFNRAAEKLFGYRREEVLGRDLNDILSPLVRGMSMGYLKFTPTEIQVANLVKHGRPTKEISDLMSLSSKTIEFHRDNIRKKLGIKNRKVNLRTYLLSLQ